MKIIYGTTNPAKLKSMRRMLDGLDIEIIGLNDIHIEVSEIDESGDNPLENARIKAKAYYNAAKVPVFSCDSGLYIEGLEEKRQPGVYARRVNGKHLSDDEMIEYYGSIAKEFGGQVRARYKNAICLIFNENNIFESMEDGLGSEKFILTSNPHVTRNEGFPLDSLSVEEKSGRYYMDIKREEREEDVVEKGFREFFERTLMEQEKYKINSL